MNTYYNYGDIVVTTSSSSYWYPGQIMIVLEENNCVPWCQAVGFNQKFIVKEPAVSVTNLVLLPSLTEEKIKQLNETVEGFEDNFKANVEYIMRNSK